MSHIAIQRPHSLTLDQARQAAENLVQRLAEHYEFSYHWQDDRLCFERSGVSGCLSLEPDQVRVNVRLGFLLMPFKPRLEQEMQRYLDEALQEFPRS